MFASGSASAYVRPPHHHFPRWIGYQPAPALHGSQPLSNHALPRVRASLPTAWL